MYFKQQTTYTRRLGWEFVSLIPPFSQRFLLNRDRLQEVSGFDEIKEQDQKASQEVQKLTNRVLGAVRISGFAWGHWTHNTILVFKVRKNRKRT